MYKKILVPLDGSKRAEAILRHVEELARSHGGEVIFLQVIEPPKVTGFEGYDPYLYQREIETLSREAQTYLEALEKIFRNKEIRVQSRVVHGPVVATILTTAETENVELIAMASHGRGGLLRVYYGSIAAGVLQRVDRPLLLIRSRKESDAAS